MVGPYVYRAAIDSVVECGTGMDSRFGYGSGIDSWFGCRIGWTMSLRVEPRLTLALLVGLERTVMGGDSLLSSDAISFYAHAVWCYVSKVASI